MKSKNDGVKTSGIQFSLFLDSVDVLLQKRQATQCRPPSEKDAVDLYAVEYLRSNLTRKRQNELYSTEPKCNIQSKLRRDFSNAVTRKREFETVKGFLDREVVNRKVNESFKANTMFADLLPGEYSAMLRAKRIVRDILGSHPNMKRILSGCAFGNGASATLKRTEADRTQKWVCKPSSTRSAFELMRNFMSSSPLWTDVLMDGDPVLYVDSKGYSVIPDFKILIQDFSELDLVPKTVDVDRIILKEPELNGFLQKGIGKEIRRKLREHSGFSLNRSGVKNSILAQEGSKSGHLATVDAERASDSLVIELYRWFLPSTWFELLMAARTPCTRSSMLLDGAYGNDFEFGNILLEMMSGMGNGFTFEAESVIFYALGKAAARESKLPFATEFVSIHGDDLIVPADVFPLVRTMYEACGIVVNKTKSFSTGPFRESCGGHFFRGHSVKPFYVTEETGSDAGDFFWLYNSLLLWVNDRFDEGFKEEFIPLLSQIASYACSFPTATCGIRSQTKFWRIPVTWSRREGLFSDPPMLHGKTSWQTQHIQTIPTPASTNMLGAYMQSLACPMHITVYDLIMGRKPITKDPWEVDVDTIEAAAIVRTRVWFGFADLGLSTPLWYFRGLKRLSKLI